jgi:hypothetical protein
MNNFFILNKKIRMKTEDGMLEGYLLYIPERNLADGWIVQKWENGRYRHIFVPVNRILWVSQEKDVDSSLG